jgi:glutamate racemase
LGFSNLTTSATSLFVPIVEEGLFEGEVTQTVIKHYFSAIDTEPKVIILGCTHFPLIQKSIQNYFPNSITIHSGEAIVEFLKRQYSIDKYFQNTELKFFATENPDRLKLTAKEWLGLEF